MELGALRVSGGIGAASGFDAASTARRMGSGRARIQTLLLLLDVWRYPFPFLALTKAVLLPEMVHMDLSKNSAVQMSV